MSHLHLFHPPVIGVTQPTGDQGSIAPPYPDAWPHTNSGYSSSIPDSCGSSRAGSPTQLTPSGSVENLRAIVTTVQTSQVQSTQNTPAKFDENVSPTVFIHKGR